MLCSDRNSSFLLFLLHNRFRHCTSIFTFEDALPIFRVFIEIFFKAKFRVHSIESIPKGVYVFIGPSRAEPSLDELKMFVIEVISFFWIVNFEYFEALNHFCRFDFISLFREYRRHDNLKVGSNRYQCMMVIMHVNLAKRITVMKGILVALKYIKFRLIDVFVLFEGVIDHLGVVEVVSRWI